MIAAEMKSDVSVVRIHDDYYEKEPQGYLLQMGQIISEAHKRQAMAQHDSIE